MDYDIQRSWSNQDIDILIYWSIYEELLIFWATQSDVGKRGNYTLGLAREGNPYILRSWSMDYDIQRSWSNRDIDILIYWSIYDEIFIFWATQSDQGKPGNNTLGLAREGNLDILRSWSMDHDIQRSWSNQDIDISIYLSIYEEIWYISGANISVF